MHSNRHGYLVSVVYNSGNPESREGKNGKSCRNKLHEKISLDTSKAGISGRTRGYPLRHMNAETKFS